ncbi:MAG: T9SS type A sorting domain-containing protein, partial [Bacteroidota bacterium]|nr:T9SS type A sorting domain-containing protein [Bacteroidota bacterium]
NLVVITVGTSTCNANAGKDTTICSGHSAVLTATGGATYSWNTGASTYKITVTPTSTSTYVVTIKIGNCSASDNVVVNVITSPIANAGADQTITVGSSATLNATGNGTYSWSNNMTGAGITVSPTITTSYTLSVISGICTSTDLVVVVVKQPCNIKVDAGNDITIDKGQKVTLHTKVIGCNGCQYNWGNGLGNTDSLVVSPTATTTYVIKVTSNDGCTAVAAVVVNIKGVGINEYNADAGSINIFPVPAENFVFIDCDRPINLIRVYNAYGDLLYEDNKSDNNRLKKIDVRKYSKGIYFIRIYTNKGNIVRKIIK